MDNRYIIGPTSLVLKADRGDYTYMSYTYGFTIDSRTNYYLKTNYQQ